MPSAGPFTSKVALKLGPAGLNFRRAGIRIHGVDQAGASFEGRVFLNNPKATLHTPLTEEHGFAGSFHVYGYGLWPDDIGKKPLVQPQQVRAPIEKRVIATEAVRRAAAQGSEITVTIVPVYPRDPPAPADEAMRLENVSVEIDPD